MFTSPEIAISKKFKKCILDHFSFTDRLCLLAVDEIHLVEEWGKNFRPMYTEIGKIRKRIPCHVPLVGILATLTKSVRSRVMEKAGFLPNYRLLQTSLDRSEIIRLHCFIENPDPVAWTYSLFSRPRPKKPKTFKKLSFLSTT